MSTSTTSSSIKIQKKRDSKGGILILVKAVLKSYDKYFHQVMTMK